MLQEDKNKKDIKNDKKEKIKNKKMGKTELIFNIVSLLFLIFFISFYGFRAIYYKNKFTPKTSNGENISLLSSELKKDVKTTSDGIYSSGSSFIYKGEKINNYVLFSNLIWRITKINSDNSIEIVLDDYLNYLAFDKEKITFKNSDIRKYLNEHFLLNLNKNLLVKSLYCEDEINDPDKITCSNKNTDYVKLLSITDYLNSKRNKNSYLDSENEVWLYNNSKEKVWIAIDGSLSLSIPNELYQIKPVVTLNNTVGIHSGDGTKTKPYQIEEKTGYFGSYVKLDDDLYQIYEIRNNIAKMILDDEYKNGNTKFQFSNSDNKYSLNNTGIGKYLNTTFLNSVDYKDILVECDWHIGEYERYYENVTKDTLKAKVGLYSIIDPIFNKNVNNYHLLTKYKNNQNYIFYNNNVFAVKSTVVKNIRPSVCIKTSSLKNGNGSKENPYNVEEVK